MKRKYLYLCALLSFLTVIQAESYSNHPSAQKFIKGFASESDYSESELTQIFNQVSRNDVILGKISNPAEKSTPWYKYKKIFLDESRIKNGIAFYQKNKKILDQAYDKYGVPPEIIVAIIGVETRYGKVMGKDKVIDALSTIAFDYPSRSPFFTKELKSFLTLAKSQSISPFDPLGSYAGAMGMTQFMPSSYIHYAVDYDADGKKDLWTNSGDAIFSVANYLKENGWQRGELIVDQAVISEPYQKPLSHKPFTTLGKLKSKGVFLKSIFATDDALVGIFNLEVSKDHSAFFITFPNFAVITTYNTSPMYAMAVFELSKKIKVTQ